MYQNAQGGKTMTLLHVGLAAELNAYADKHGPVTVGLAGSGQMGTDMVVSSASCPACAWAPCPS